MARAASSGVTEISNFRLPRDRQLIAFQAKGDKAVSVFFVLRGDKRNAAQQPTHKFTQFGIAFRRAFGQTSVSDHQRGILRLCSVATMFGQSSVSITITSFG